MGCCQTLSGLSCDCNSNIGGIRRVWIACYDRELTPGAANNVISDISSIKEWHEYRFKKQTGSVSTTITRDDANGTLYYESSIVLQFSKMDTDKRVEINALAVNDLFAVIEDNNGKYWFFGYDFPVTISDGTIESGTALGDFNGYNITLNDLSKELPHEVNGKALDTLNGKA